MIFKMRKRFKESGNNNWATYSLISGICMVTFFILASFGFKQVTGLLNFAGLFQRLSVISGATWLATVLFFIIKKSKQIY
jgi:hypothetical protein